MTDMNGCRPWIASKLFAAAVLMPSVASAQSVCLPAPRLLTTMPMGGQVGSTLDVTISGEHLEDADVLSFSHPGVTATHKLDTTGQPLANQYVVSIASDCPPGLYEARVMTRLGGSTSRIFSVGSLPELTRQQPNASLETALPLGLDIVCNAAMTAQAIDYYTFEATQGQRVVIDCAAQGVDSKLKPVLIVADAEGNDLQAERRGGALDFTAPESAKYVVKVHDLTFSGGPHYFYRLALMPAAAGDEIARLPSTTSVSACSWPPIGLNDESLIPESEPNNDQPQQITLPCDVAGSFFPAADVDVFEFHAAKGDVWWVEVASQRLGRPTDAAVVVQHVSGEGTAAMLTDVAELSDIASPVKVSSNNYSYDGPPYNAGSTDVLGKVEIKEDGLHRLQLVDLFGGTRNDAANTYRLIVRKAQPDFALVGWALHMNLRNGDRNALSKPMALRGGATMALEVIAIRRDGFDGEIELDMENLPDGVAATGLTIPAGQSRGIMLVTADASAPPGLTSANFVGRATINDEVVTRPCRLASMSWPVRDAWSEIPSPRLLADVPISVCGSELAPITIAPTEDKVWEVAAGQKLTIPLTHTRRCEFSGANISLSTFGRGFEGVPVFDAPLQADASEAVLDTAALKTPPGEYVIAFYGSAVAKYRDNLAAVTLAEAALKQAQEALADLEAEVAQLAAAEAATSTEPVESKAVGEQAAAALAERQKDTAAAVAAAEERVKAATANAAPQDIVDIVVSHPIRIRVTPAEAPSAEQP